MAAARPARGLRRLLPGAAFVGIGQVVVIALSGIYLQPTIESQAQRYGLIGVAFVLVSWLIVLGLLIVLAAVLSAESDGAPGSRSTARRPRRRAMSTGPPPSWWSRRRRSVPRRPYRPWTWRTTNLALFGVLALAFVSGAAAQATGSQGGASVASGTASSGLS